jgi:hypothetical protein
MVDSDRRADMAYGDNRRPTTCFCSLALLLAIVLSLTSCSRLPTASNKYIVTGQMLQAGGVVSLFDGESLGQWKQTPFEEDGKSYVEDGRIVMSMGRDMSGITWTGPLLRMDYEISLEAMRLAGTDFFCGLTFPVNESPCTLVVGGWGGGLVGLSNIDYYDAANNETSRSLDVESGKWYRIRLRVTQKTIQAWIDDEMIVNFEWPGHKLDVRMEVDLSVPLGIATWQTAGTVRNIEVRKVDKAADTPEMWY